MDKEIIRRVVISIVIVIAFVAIVIGLSGCGGIEASVKFHTNAPTIAKKNADGSWVLLEDAPAAGRSAETDNWPGKKKERIIVPIQEGQTTEIRTGFTTFKKGT